MLSRPKELTIEDSDYSLDEEEVSDNWKKQQRYVHKCKEAAWKRWDHEYLAALRESYTLSHNEKPVKINIKHVVTMKGEESWKVEDWNY